MTTDQIGNPRVDALNRLLHDTVNSVIQYADISAPHVPKGYDDQVAELRKIADEEKVLANDLVDLIGRCEGVPQVGVFPYWNVDLNYLDLRFMAKFAREHQEASIARLEAELAGMQDDPEVHSFLKRALAQKIDHLARLAGVAGDYGS